MNSEVSIEASQLGDFCLAMTARKRVWCPAMIPRRDNKIYTAAIRSAEVTRARLSVEARPRFSLSCGPPVPNPGGSMRLRVGEESLRR